MIDLLGYPLVAFILAMLVIVTVLQGRIVTLKRLNRALLGDLDALRRGNKGLQEEVRSLTDSLERRRKENDDYFQQVMKQVALTHRLEAETERLQKELDRSNRKWLARWFVRSRKDVKRG